MISKIKFDLDFETKQAVITGVVSTEGSDDVRDAIAKSFTRGFNGSSLCRIQFRKGSLSVVGGSRIETEIGIPAVGFTITPIPDNSEGKVLADELRSRMSPTIASPESEELIDKKMFLLMKQVIDKDVSGYEIKNQDIINCMKLAYRADH